MTKFTKGIVFTGVFALSVVGGYKAYNYIKDIYEEKETSNVSTEKINEISSFLNDSTNIGFIQANYDSLDLSKLSFDEVYKLLSNIYSFDDTGKLKKNNLNETNAYKSFKGDYITNVSNPKVCYNKEAVNTYLYSITNQKLNSSSNELCTTFVDLYTYIAKINITLVRKTDNTYNIKYKAYDAENLIYIQKNKYEGMGIEKTYNGKVVLEYIDDRYIFVSNTISNGKNIDKLAK